HQHSLLIQAIAPFQREYFHGKQHTVNHHYQPKKQANHSCHHKNHNAAHLLQKKQMYVDAITLYHLTYNKIYSIIRGTIGSQNYFYTDGIRYNNDIFSYHLEMA